MARFCISTAASTACSRPSGCKLALPVPMTTWRSPSKRPLFATRHLMMNRASSTGKDGTFLWYRYLVETTPAVACRWDVFASECPSRLVLGRVANKWTMLVIRALAESEVLRFSQLRRRVEGVTQKMLTRTVYPTVPATVEYRLTPLGTSLAGAVNVIKEWAYANIDQIERARKLYD